jgi:hypothetical protein
MLARFARLDYGLRGSHHEALAAPSAPRGAEALDRKRPPARLALLVFLFLLLVSVVVVLHARGVGDQSEAFHTFTPMPTNSL